MTPASDVNSITSCVARSALASDAASPAILASASLKPSVVASVGASVSTRFVLSSIVPSLVWNVMPSSAGLNSASVFLVSAS